METIRLWDGREVPRIGVGCWAIGGTDYGEVVDDVSLAGLRLAYDLGARLFDTAIAYGEGRSERLLGEAFRGIDDVVIVTKFGHPVERLSPRAITASIEASRVNLQRDRIDLALFHVNEFDPDEAGFVFDTLAELRERDWIGAFGWSTDATASVEAFADRDGFVAVENDLNVFTPADELMAFAEERQLVSINRLPLAMGMLSGKYNGGRTVGAGDIRAGQAEWLTFFKDGKADPDYVRRLESLRELLTTGGRTSAQGALSWILAHSPRALPVPGFKTEDQIRDNLATLEHGPLPIEIMVEIRAVLGNERAA